jgi:hypothetical protein
MAKSGRKTEGDKSKGGNPLECGKDSFRNPHEEFVLFLP